MHVWLTVAVVMFTPCAVYGWRSQAAKEAEAVAAAERAKEEARHAAMAAAAADDDDTGEGELVLSNDIAMDLL